MDQLDYEEKYRGQGKQYICGVDEAGRGPLAGPVCAAAVILHPGQRIEGVNDSKKLTPKKREALYEVILQEALCCSIGWASVEEIDQLNILRATFLAMNRAVEGLKIQPDFVLVDGNQDPGLGIETFPLVKGDSMSLSIGAASILAKVTRDRYMLELDQQYPQYGFQKHKGYPTAQHYAALRQYGPSPVHRLTFLKKMH